MLIPLVKNSTIDYSLQSDTSEPKTIFKLRFLNARQKAIWMVLSTQYINTSKDSRSWWFPMIRIGIAGWSNLKTINGTEFEYKTEKISVPGFGEIDAVSDEVFEAFQIEIIEELARKLFDINNPSVEEKKST
jgi:hypothetical protein